MSIWMKYHLVGAIRLSEWFFGSGKILNEERVLETIDGDGYGYASKTLHAKMSSLPNFQNWQGHDCEEGSDSQVSTSFYNRERGGTV